MSIIDGNVPAMIVREVSSMAVQTLIMYTEEKTKAAATLARVIEISLPKLDYYSDGSEVHVFLTQDQFEDMKQAWEGAADNWVDHELVKEYSWSNSE